jgi:hypothetical protein
MSLSPYALTSLAAVKRFLPNAVDPSKEDQEFLILIDAVTWRLENYAGRRLKARTYMPSGAVGANAEMNRILNGNARHSSTMYLLPEYPVNSITAGIIKDRYLTTVKTLDVNTDLVFDPDTGIVSLIDGDVWELGIQNIHLTWNAGVTTVPHDLEVACIIQVLNDYMVISRDRLGVTSFSVEGESISVEHKDLLDRVKGAVNHYRAAGIG